MYQKLNCELLNLPARVEKDISASKQLVSLLNYRTSYSYIQIPVRLRAKMLGRLNVLIMQQTYHNFSIINFIHRAFVESFKIQSHQIPFDIHEILIPITLKYVVFKPELLRSINISKLLLLIFIFISSTFHSFLVFFL